MYVLTKEFTLGTILYCTVFKLLSDFSPISLISNLKTIQQRLELPLRHDSSYILILQLLDHISASYFDSLLDQ